MEENRLKQMPENYDRAIFESIYHKTINLRNKLAYGIDARRFGVDQDEIKSWFDVKFIYAFTKYHDQHNEEVLKGHIIRALQFFQLRIMRSAYTEKFSQTIDDIDDVNVEDLLVEDPYDSRRVDLYNDTIKFMKEHLSENAFDLLLVTLNPPPYIRYAMELKGKDINRIPNSVYAEYYELGDSKKAIQYIKSLREEIEEVTALARKHFN